MHDMAKQSLSNVPQLHYFIKEVLFDCLEFGELAEISWVPY